MARLDSKVAFITGAAGGIGRAPRVEGLLGEREELRKLAGQHLLGPCRPNDIAELAVYLGSDESRVVTGQVISVDSGVTIS